MPGKTETRTTGDELVAYDHVDKTYIKRNSVSKREINVINVRSVSADELVRYIFPLIKVPVITPNRPIDVEGELAPLLAIMANEAAFITHLYSVCVGLKADMRTKDGLANASNPVTEMTAKIDILYRAQQSAKQQYNALSRILEVIKEKPHSKLRKAMK